MTAQRNRGRRMRGPRAVGELMGATLGTYRIAKGIEKSQPLLLWRQAVGPEIARITRPRSVQGSTLFVEVRDSATAHHLSMQRHHFLVRLNALLGEVQVSEIRFGVGQIRAPELPPAPRPLPPADKARATQLAQGVSEELYPVVLKTAEAITRARRWREQQGWQPCPVCGELGPDGGKPCRACRLTLQDPNVLQAARRLVRQPEELVRLVDMLGNSGADGARYLALEQLHERLELLALECVREQGDSLDMRERYRQFLGEEASIYLALKLRKPRTGLKRSDRAALPERVRNVLSALE